MRYLVALLGAWPWLLGAVVLAVLLARWPLLDRLGARPRRVTVLALAALASARALADAWVCDDAFISFRYARNLVDGLGLVYNPGERVEGYTNLLWTLIAALPIELGVHPAPVMIVLSALALGALVWLSARLAARDRERPGFPLASLIVGLNVIMVSFGTSGLETMFAALLVLAAIERAEAARPLQAGTLAILAVLAHPDHALFYAALGASVALERDWRALLRYAAPFVFLFVPALAFRVLYYGEWLPNTYYAKSGDLSYFSQGIPYVVVSGIACGVFALVPLALYGGIVERRRHLARFVLFGVPPYLLYVAKIGGDFMLGRLLVPLIAPLAVLAELGLRALFARERRRLGAALALVGLLAAVPTHPLLPGEKYHHIADEQSFYRLERWSPVMIRSRYQRWADAVHHQVVERGLSPVFGIGCLGIVGFETGLFIVDTFGLTEKNVARLPLLRRDRPGHEKRPSQEYLVSRGVDFSDHPIFPPQYSTWTRFWLDGVDFYYGRYTPGFAARLQGQKGVRAADTPHLIDGYHIPPEPGRLDCDLWFFESFYFAHDEAPERRARLERKLVRHDPSLAGYEGLLLGDPPAEWQAVSRFDLSPSDFSRWRVEGGAFAPSRGTVSGQRTVIGNQGSFATSYALGARDAAVGKLSRTFVVEGDVLTFRLAGGSKRNSVGVRLLAAGEVVRETYGCEFEALGRRVWPVANLRGTEVTLEVVDAGTGAWGHIAIDEVVQWRKRR